MIPTIVRLPISIAQQLAGGAVRVGVGLATEVLHRVLPGGEGAEGPQDRGPAQRADSSGGASVVDITPPRPAVDVDPVTQPKPAVDVDPVTQPAATDLEPTPGATTTLADPAPATANPATRSTARRATARQGPAKKATAKKPAAGATAAKKAVDKKTPATKATPTKPASTLDEPVAPVDDDPVVYSTGPE